MKYLIKGGKLFDPKVGLNEVYDVRIEDGFIKEVGRDLPPKDCRIVNARGLHVFPGFIDLHAHLREPGEEYKEDLETGGLAALYGGFTTVCTMPNTKPPLDSPELISSIIERSKDLKLSEIFPIGTITLKRQGKLLAEMARMAKAGAVAFSDDGDWVSDSGIMRRALEYTKITRRPIVTHPQDKTLTRKGSMHEGSLSYILGLGGIPEESETSAVYRDISLARLTGGRLHIAHVSSHNTVKLVKEAKSEGLWVTAEVTPHHLIFSHEELKGFDTNYKMNPPLRTEEDRKALVEGLKEGIIDAIATDHAPHAYFEKQVEFDAAPFGVIGLQTAFSSLFTLLVLKGELDLETLILRLTSGPASLFGFEGKGRIQPGFKADLAIFDLEASWEVTRELLQSRSKNTPLFGRKLKGVPRFVFVDGRLFEMEV